MAREIINHRSLRHPNIIRFKEVLSFFSHILKSIFTEVGDLLNHKAIIYLSSIQVVLTPTHLAIAMEYAAGGELFERICSAGRFSEDEVSFAF